MKKDFYRDIVSQHKSAGTSNVRPLNLGFTDSIISYIGSRLAYNLKHPKPPRIFHLPPHKYTFPQYNTPPQQSTVSNPVQRMARPSNLPPHKYTFPQYNTPPPNQPPPPPSSDDSNNSQPEFPYASEEERKRNRYRYLRRQVARRREIYDQYKWLKPIAKANPTIAKNLPKIAKRLDSIASIPGMVKYVKNPMTLAASALGAFVRGYASSLKAMSAMNKRSILERFYGKPTSEATLFASGMNYEDAIKSSGKFAALSSRLQRGIGTELFELAGIYGVPELAIWGDPLVSIDEKKRVTQQAVKRLPEGDRINILSAYGITPEEYNAASLQGKSLKDLTPAQKGDLYAGIADKYMKEVASRNWFSSLLYTSGASDFIARDLAKDEYGSLMQFLFGGTAADKWRYVLAKEAELTLGTKTMRNAELAAQSLNDSNIRTADADIAAMTNYSMTERPVTVVIQGDIRTDADNGQRLFDDIDKRYNLGSLTEIAEPVAKSFDSKIKR